MAKSATSLLRTFPRPFGEVEPTIGAPRRAGRAHDCREILGHPARPGVAWIRKDGKLLCNRWLDRLRRERQDRLSGRWRDRLARISAEAAAPPSAMPQYSFAVLVDRTAVRHHAIRDFLSLGRKLARRQKHCEAEPSRCAHGAAAAAQASPDQKTNKSGARPDAFRFVIARNLGQQMRPHQGNQDSARLQNCGQMLGLMGPLWLRYDAAAMTSRAASSSSPLTGASVGPSR